MNKGSWKSLLSTTFSVASDSRSAMSNLAPLPLKRVNMSNKALDTSVDDFDDLLDDMLDSPRATRRDKNISKGRLADNENEINDFDMITESFSDPSSPTSTSPIASKKALRNPEEELNELSIDNGYELLSNLKVTSDDLEDSILGGLLKGNKNLNIKKPLNNPAISAKDLTNSKGSNAKSSWGVTPSLKAEVVESPVENYSDDEYESSDDDAKSEKGKSSYSSSIGNTARKPYSFSSRTSKSETPVMETQQKV